MRIFEKLGITKAPSKPDIVDGSNHVAPHFRPAARRNGHAASDSVPFRTNGVLMKLPAYVVKYRGQKICSFCKHSIDEDPYFQKQNYWVRYAQHQALETLASILSFFSAEVQQKALERKRRLMLPGWARCKNPRCGQLYHANCWHQLKSSRGCFRCRSRQANRVA